MDQPQQIPINLSDLIQLRINMDNIMSPCTELEAAIVHFEKEIAKALTAFTVNIPTPTQETLPNG